MVVASGGRPITTAPAGLGDSWVERRAMGPGRPTLS